MSASAPSHVPTHRFTHMVTAVGQSGSSLIEPGSRGSTQLAVCRNVEEAAYAWARERMIDPSGRCAAMACQGLKESTSSA